MTITERTLRNWRREALNDQNIPSDHPMLITSDAKDVKYLMTRVKQLSERILRLTQDQLDLYLIKPKH